MVSKPRKTASTVNHIKHTKRVGVGKLLGEWYSLSLWQTLHESQSLQVRRNTECQLLRKYCTKRERHTFSLAIVWITSSGGVPNNSVMIENWFTSRNHKVRGFRSVSQTLKGKPSCGNDDSRSFPGNKGFPSNISAKMHPVLQMSTVQKKGRR
jgi:hypothetical protein